MRVLDVAPPPTTLSKPSRLGDLLVAGGVITPQQLKKALDYQRTKGGRLGVCLIKQTPSRPPRSEEHTSELQSPCNLVCRLLLEKKKNNNLNTQACVDYSLTRLHARAHIPVR